MELHLPTLLVVTAVVLMFTGMMLAVLARGPYASAPVRCWGGAMVAGAAGLVLLAAGDVPALPGLAGNMLVLAGTGLLWTGSRLFIGVPARPGVVAAGPLLWLGGALAPAWMPPGVPLGVPADLPFVAQVIGSIYVFAAAAELWRGRDERLRSRKVAMALLVFHGVVHLARAGSIAAGWGAAHEAAASGLLLMEALLNTVGLAFAVLAMMKERAELQSTRQLRILAMMDGLTSLSNRRQFDTVLQSEHGRAVSERRALALLMVDVDCFKAYNDIYGHQAGDDALRALAAAVQRASHRPADMAARYGGEEFALLLPRTDEAGALAVADAIHRNVSELELLHTGNPHGRLSVSIGVALVWPGPQSDPSELVRAADLALYAAKRGGRNRTAGGAPAAESPGPALLIQSGGMAAAGE